MANSHGLHARCPWRLVTHISPVLGARGGRGWVLTLECGHYAARHGRRFRLYDALTGKYGKAPQRVRCLFCRVDTLAAEQDEPVPPCPECGSAELCHPNCWVAPWNLEPT